MRFGVLRLLVNELCKEGARLIEFSVVSKLVGLGKEVIRGGGSHHKRYNK